MVARNSKPETLNPKPRIRKGDTVRILLGKDRGKSAKVMTVFPQEGRIIVEGIQMAKKHIRPRKTGEKGQRVSIATPFDLSNAQLVCPSCKKGTRVGIVRGEEGRQRVCRKCDAVIDDA